MKSPLMEQMVDFSSVRLTGRQLHLFARIMGMVPAPVRESILPEVTDSLKKTNPNFNEGRFQTAVIKYSHEYDQKVPGRHFTRAGSGVVR